MGLENLGVVEAGRIKSNLFINGLKQIARFIAR